MRTVFADLKTDFVFKKVFGSEDHKDLLIALLNALLSLSDERAIASVTFLREEERPRVDELKFSVVDVKCRDHRGTTFVVEMQVLNVAGFEKRVVYNASKTYVNQLVGGQDYPRLNDVIAISICNFELWPDASGSPQVPLVSHWRMQEQHGGRLGLSQVQYVFVELPKLPLNRDPVGSVEEWAWVFRMGSRIDAVPLALHDPATRRALEATRAAGFTAAEWEVYDRAKVAEQDARGALELVESRALDRGRAEGRAEGHAEALRRPFERRLGRSLTDDELDALRAKVASLGAERVGDALMDLDAASLGVWLCDPSGR